MGKRRGAIEGRETNHHHYDDVASPYSPEKKGAASTTRLRNTKRRELIITTTWHPAICQETARTPQAELGEGLMLRVGLSPLRPGPFQKSPREFVGPYSEFGPKARRSQGPAEVKGPFEGSMRDSDIGTDLPCLTQATFVRRFGTVGRGVSTDLQGAEVSRTGIKCRSMLDNHIKCKGMFDKTAFRMSSMRRRDPAKEQNPAKSPKSSL
ncbi:unnamed protein product [Cochlearia groenlandica]